MAKVGWLKLHRKIIEWEYFTNPECVQLLVYLLCHADEEGNIYTTVERICTDLRLTRQVVRDRLKKLASTNTSTIKSTINGTHITLCNFTSYNSCKNESQPLNQPTNQPTKKETNKENISPTPPLKENKKENSPSLHLTVEPPPSKIYREVVELWDKICTSSPRLRAHSQARQNKVLCRVKEMGGYPKAIATITEMFTVVQSNSFYTGDNSRGWVAGFDWFFENSTNWCKVIERVHNSKSNGQKYNSASKAEHIASERERIMREVASAAPRECDAPSWLK